MPSSPVDQLLALAVQHSRFEHHDWIWITDRGAQQAVRVLGVGHHTHLEAPDAAEPIVEHLRVLAPESESGTGRGPHDEWHGNLAPGEVAQPGGLCRQLIEGHADELDEHDLDHWFESRCRCADGGAEEAHLADRRVEDTARTERLVESFRALEGPTGDGDVLAHHDHVWIALHLVVQGLEDCSANEHPRRFGGGGGRSHNNLSLVIGRGRRDARRGRSPRCRANGTTGAN